ncbi:MAG: ABC transporter ATP-binding protein/permease [Paenibacillus sp.]|nr:ABC transporter ATP-binding protein/permease [Paenibacillus sp.]
MNPITASELESNPKTKKEQSGFRLYLWLISYVKPYIGPLTVMVCCGLLTAGGELVFPKVIERLIDEIIPAKDYGAFSRLIVLLIGVVAITIAAALLRNSFQRSVGAKAARDLQLAVFQHLRKLGFSYYEQHPVGESLSLMNNQVKAVQRLYTGFFPEMFETAIFVMLAVIMMVQGNVVLTLAAVPFFFVYYLFGPYFDRKMAHWSKNMNNDRIEFNRKIHETVFGIREFRAYAVEDWDLQRGMKKYEAVTNSTLKWVFFLHSRWGLRKMFFQAGSVGLFAAGYWLIREGSLTVGAFLSFFLIYSIVMEKLSQLIGNIAEQSMLLQQAYPLHKLMLLKPEVEEPENPIPLRDPKGRISFHGLSFHYLNRPMVIRDFTLDILPGERVAIVGGSGNGKSTLLKLICRFYDPQAGSIELDGIPVQHLSFQDLRGQVGYVSQESHLFGLSIRDNIKFGSPEATDEEMEQAAKDAFAHEFILNLPLGYDTLIGDRGMKLSGGQKQRIAIARLLIRNPRIVLLDEATSALDNVSESEVKTALDRLFEGRTMIAVAHRLTTIQDFDRIVVMNEGKVAEVGTYAVLMERQGLFYELAQGQKREPVHGVEPEVAR